MTLTAKLFMSGRSQAIRLPAKLRLDAKEVRVQQVGGAFWVQAEASPEQNMADWLREFYRLSEALPDTFLGDRDDGPLQTCDWS